jgi:hypothetical protein
MPTLKGADSRILDWLDISSISPPIIITKILSGRSEDIRTRARSLQDRGRLQLYRFAGGLGAATSA